MKLTIISVRALFFLLVLFCISPLYSQSEDLEIITFSDDGNSRTDSDRSNSTTMLIIKTNPLSFLYGKQFIEAEYILTDYLTVEGGVGLTFRPFLDSYTTIYSEILTEIASGTDCSSPNYTEENNFCDQQLYNDFSIRNFRTGAYLSGGLKFYLYNDAPDGLYVSLNLKYFRNNYEVLSVEESIQFTRTTDQYVNERVNNIDYTVRLGNQLVYNPLVTDVFVGLGVRSSNANRLDVGFDSVDRIFTNSFQDVKASSLVIEAGLRLGFELRKKKAPVKKKKKKKRKRR